MESIQMAVKPIIARGLQEAQLYHALPIHMTVGKITDGMVEITLEYDEEDEKLVEWFTETVIDRIIEGRFSIDQTENH